MVKLYPNTTASGNLSENPGPNPSFRISLHKEVMSFSLCFLTQTFADNQENLIPDNNFHCGAASNFSCIHTIKFHHNHKSAAPSVESVSSQHSSK